MKPELVLHETTKKQINLLIKNPVHAIGIEAPDGMGKGSLASLLIAKLLKIDFDKLANYPYLFRVQPSGVSISIDNIRQLQHFLELKTIGDKTTRRAVIIEHAETMTKEAQNALLKTLEEPPEDTVIVLTTSSSKSLLPTVTSRLRLISATRPTKNQLEEFFASQNVSSSEFNKAFMLCGGLPGLIQAIFDNSEDHPLLSAASKAKELLSVSRFQKLVMVDDLAKSKTDTLLIFQAMSRAANIGLERAANQKDDKLLDRWQQILTSIEKALKSMASNAQSKLILTNLMLEI